MFRSALSLSVALILGAGPQPAARAQLPQAQPQGLDQQRFNEGQAALQANDYPKAIKAFEAIPKDYPTSAFIPAATLQAGIAYFYAGDFDKGINTLRKNLTAKGVPPEVLEDSFALVPQLLAAKAQKLPEGDPARKATLEAAVKEFDIFISKFPQSPEVENANLGKARSLYFLKKYEESATALRAWRNFRRANRRSTRSTCWRWCWRLRAMRR